MRSGRWRDLRQHLAHQGNEHHSRQQADHDPEEGVGKGLPRALSLRSICRRLISSPGRGLDAGDAIDCPSGNDPRSFHTYAFGASARSGVEQVTGQDEVQAVEIQRFDHVVIGAEAPRLALKSGIVERAHDDERRAAMEHRRNPREPSQNLETAGGHHDVAQHDAGPKLENGVESCPAVDGKSHIVAALVEFFRNQVRGLSIILYAEQ